MKLTATEAPKDKAINLEGLVRQSAFLGETWDYVFQPKDSGLQFRVAAPPADVFQVGAPAWLQIDPAQIVPIVD
jgi:iron(III) transport system ATP-binding protein